MKWIKQKYDRWKAIRDFRARCRRLAVAMPADAIRNLLGSPDHITSRENETSFFEEWRYFNAVGEKTDLVLLLNDGSELVSWRREHIDDSATPELFVKTEQA